MPISFTVIKNRGAMCVPDRDSNSVFYTLSMQVTNDSDGNDLDKFEKVINDVTNNHPEKFLVPYKGAISFNVVEHPPEDKFSGSTYNFYLNGTPLKIDDKNLKAFSYMAKIFNKVSKKDDDVLSTAPKGRRLISF